LLGGVEGLPLHKADGLTAEYLETVGASMSHKPIVLHGLSKGYLYFTIDVILSIDIKKMLKIEYLYMKISGQ
jgi:hypothetical protein